MCVCCVYIYNKKTKMKNNQRIKKLERDPLQRNLQASSGYLSNLCTFIEQRLEQVVSSVLQNFCYLCKNRKEGIFIERGLELEEDWKKNKKKNHYIWVWFRKRWCCKTRWFRQMRCRFSIGLRSWNSRYCLLF